MSRQRRRQRQPVRGLKDVAVAFHDAVVMTFAIPCGLIFFLIMALPEIILIPMAMGERFLERLSALRRRDNRRR